jgi:hypothetical protein
MRSVPVLTAVIIGAAAVVAGCGQQHPGSGVAAPASSASPSHPMVACANASPAAQPSKLTITAADNGKSFCVTRDTNVAVFLKGTQARKWEPIRTSSAVLQPHASGEFTLPIGVTGASFAAVQPGTAIISSGQPACGPSAPPKGNSSQGSGTLECGAILVFRVTVTVVR